MTTEDSRILEMLFARDEKALHVLTRQYGRAGRKIAREILHSEADAEEVWNDTLLHLWNAVPPAKPDDLFAYICTIAKRLSLQRLEKRNAIKRGGGQPELSLEAISERHLSAASPVEELMERSMMLDAVNRFLSAQSPDARTIFLEHYGAGKTVSEIAAEFQLTRSKVTVTLMRTRVRLRKYLSEEGWL